MGQNPYPARLLAHSNIFIYAANCYETFINKAFDGR